MRRSLIAIATIVATLAAAGVANAVEPTRDTVTLHRVINPFLVCPGFNVIGTFDITREITTFYDQSGTPVMRIIRADIDGTVTNSVTGYSLPAPGVRIFHYDLVTGELFTTGSNDITKLPTGGVANPGSGRLVFDSAGHLIEHTGPTSSDEIAELCAALAG